MKSAIALFLAALLMTFSAAALSDETLEPATPLSAAAPVKPGFYILFGWRERHSNQVFKTEAECHKALIDRRLAIHSAETKLLADAAKSEQQEDIETSEVLQTKTGDLAAQYEALRNARCGEIR